MRMGHIVICSLPRPTKFFPHFLINGTIFERKKVTEHEMFFTFPLQLLSETFFILQRTEGDMIKMLTGVHVKYHVSLPDFNENLNFLDRF
jgi:hypothetical protein